MLPEPQIQSIACPVHQMEQGKGLLRELFDLLYLRGFLSKDEEYTRGGVLFNVLKGSLLG